MDVNKMIGINICRYRYKRGISQDTLALIVGYSGKSMVSRIETGKVDLPTSKLIDIARVLDVDVTALLEGAI